MKIICYIDITVYGLLQTSVSISKQHWGFIHSFLALIQRAKCFKWAKWERNNTHLDGIPVFAMIDLGPGMILWNFHRQLRSQIAMDDFFPMGHLHRLQFDYNDYRRYASRLMNQSYRSLRQTTETIAHWGSKTISIVHCGKRNKTIVPQLMNKTKTSLSVCLSSNKSFQTLKECSCCCCCCFSL